VTFRETAAPRLPDAGCIVLQSETVNIRFVGMVSTPAHLRSPQSPASGTQPPAAGLNPQSSAPASPSFASRPLRKVLLAVPPTGLYIREDRCQTPIEHMTTIALRPPIDLLYAAAAFEQGGAECRLVDYPGEQWGEDRLRSDLLEFRPDLVLLSITTPGFDADMQAAALIKRTLPSTVVAAKGAHFNTLDEIALRRYPGLDLALRGEFEPACRELAEGKPWDQIAGIAFHASGSDPASPVVRTPDRPFIEDLDSLPFPARHLADNALYARPDTGELQTTIVTNRGCPFNCCYCLANQVAGRRNRMRSPGNIIAEIEECVSRHGIRNFLFRSDLFTARREWVLELCALIRSRGLDIAWSCNSRVDTIDPELLEEMKRAGCWIIAYGIESGSQEMLDRIGKRTNLDSARKALAMTRRAKVLSSVYFLVGLPWETHETLRANERFAREIDPDVLEVFYVYPFPGTALYEECVRLGLLGPGEIPLQAYDRPAMRALALSKEELVASRNHALRSFYLQPRVILRTLLRARSRRELMNYVRYGWRQVKEFL
jgi:anaerobic magnesium-protoporphyrin IX monomethyl ester cyclase